MGHYKYVALVMKFYWQVNANHFFATKLVCYVFTLNCVNKSGLKNALKLWCKALLHGVKVKKIGFPWKLNVACV